MKHWTRTCLQGAWIQFEPAASIRSAVAWLPWRRQQALDCHPHQLPPWSWTGMLCTGQAQAFQVKPETGGSKPNLLHFLTVED
eukprot:2669468-Rhodomonas_salina.14